MIQANELMIGDWVKFTSKYGYGTGQVVGIEPREGSAEPTTFTIWKKDKEGNTKFFVGVSKNCVDPIPLTSKILEKNGFELRREKVWRWISEDERTEIRFVLGAEHIHIIKNAYYEDEVEFSLPCPNCVHELQHALRLCGIEKEIAL